MKFKYGDEVKVINGFFKGLIGTIMSAQIHDWIFRSKK